MYCIYVEATEGNSMNGECPDTQTIRLTSHSCSNSALSRMCNNQPKELITSKVITWWLSLPLLNSLAGWLGEGVGQNDTGLSFCLSTFVFLTGVAHFVGGLQLTL